MLAMALAATPCAAQDVGLVEALAPILMAEDRRLFEPGLFSRSIIHSDPTVRRVAAVAIGRIGDLNGTSLLLSLLTAPDRDVHADAFFALGLLRDSTAVPAIIARLRSVDSLPALAAAEGATALAKIGGAQAARFLGDAIASGADLPRGRRAALLATAVMETRRLGTRAPVASLIAFATDTSTDLRWRSVYVLGRLMAPGSGDAILRAMRDESALIRESAARALTRRYADTVGLSPAAVRSELIRAFSDQSVGVRTNAMVSAATWADSAFTPRAIGMLRDADPNARVAAAVALGEFRGSSAVAELDSVFSRRDATWALKRAALISLAKLDTVKFAVRAGEWARSPDWRDRVAALDGWALRRPESEGSFRIGLTDPDPRVRAAAIGAWRSARPRGDSALAVLVRERLLDTDPMVRGAAVSALGADVRASDVPALLAAWTLSATDEDPDTRTEIFRALSGLSRRDETVFARLDAAFLRPPREELLRRAAENSWPELAERWGPSWPVETGRTLEDYRGVVRTILLAKEAPRVTFDIDGRGMIEVELLGRDAPLTVANFLRWVERQYVGGNRRHRVVPNFVVQDGDRSGTGSGGPGWAIRDEINRFRYDVPMLGMALSGPDTGGSQWFINLSPQPHLDGTYTIFGRVTGSYNSLRRIVQGDVIRSVRRKP